MSNALITSLGGAVPDHIRKAFAQQAANAALAAGVSAGYPIISYKGKVWHIVEGGERTLVTIGEGRNANDPAASLEAVIILANPALNKVYYPDGYEEGSTERPLCHSDDGITPAADAQEKQSPACGTCPHNEWGSKISDTGSRGKACADSRRMAIASPDDLDNPMLLRCPAASLKTLLAFGQQLDKRGWPYFALVTRIGFDSSLAYPALTFSPERWLDEDELAKVTAMQDDDLVKTITAMKTTTTGQAAQPAPQEDDAFTRMQSAPPPRPRLPSPPPRLPAPPLRRSSASAPRRRPPPRWPPPCSPSRRLSRNRNPRRSPARASVGLAASPPPRPRRCRPPPTRKTAPSATRR